MYSLYYFIVHCEVVYSLYYFIVHCEVVYSLYYFIVHSEVMSELQREDSSGSEDEQRSSYDSDSHQEALFTPRRVRRSRDDHHLIDADDVSPLVPGRRRMSISGPCEDRRSEAPIKSILRKMAACEIHDLPKERHRLRVTFSETPDFLSTPRQGRRSSVDMFLGRSLSPEPEGCDTAAPNVVGKRRRNSLPHLGLDTSAHKDFVVSAQQHLPTIISQVEDEDEEDQGVYEEEEESWQTQPSRKISDSSIDEEVVCEVVHSFTPRPTPRGRRCSYAGITALENNGASSDAMSSASKVSPNDSKHNKMAAGAPRSTAKTTSQTCGKKTDVSVKVSTSGKTLPVKPSVCKSTTKTDNSKPKTDSTKSTSKTNGGKSKPASARRHSVF